MSVEMVCDSELDVGKVKRKTRNERKFIRRRDNSMQCHISVSKYQCREEVQKHSQYRVVPGNMSSVRLQNIHTCLSSSSSFHYDWRM